MDSLTQKILNVMCEHPEIEGLEFNLESRLREDLGLDSLVIAELAICLEDLFDIRFPESLVSEIGSVGDVVNAVRLQVDPNSDKK